MPLDYNNKIVIVILRPSLCPILSSSWLEDTNDEEANSPLLFLLSRQQQQRCNLLFSNWPKRLDERRKYHSSRAS
jgi:hypothetical protein